MYISTTNPNISLYFNTTKNGNIVLQVVTLKDFRNSIKIFFNAEDCERLIAVVDNFLAGKPIQNPIQIVTNPASAISLSISAQDNKRLLLILTTNINTLTIPLNKIQATALRRYFIYWPVYSALINLDRFNTRQPTNTQPQTNNYTTNYQQNTQPNYNLQSNNRPIQQPSMQDVSPEDIISELDDLIT